MQSASDDRKRPYLPSSIATLPLENANRLIVECTHCSVREATDMLESMSRELSQKERSAADHSDRWKNSA